MNTIVTIVRSYQSPRRVHELVLDYDSTENDRDNNIVSTNDEHESKYLTYLGSPHSHTHAQLSDQTTKTVAFRRVQR